MTPSFLARSLGLAGLLYCLAGMGCSSAPDDGGSVDIEARLPGTWLREYTQDGIPVRRVLVLEAGGRFRETSRSIGAQPPEPDHEHAGEWVYDGTNLKRRYTIIDGKQPSAPAMPFATFELKFASRNEFTGLDRVRRHEVRYRRVADGTVP